MAFERSSGILLHPTSLPGRYGIGDIGEVSKNWVDFLVSAGQRLWQVMPLGPTGYGDSPYQCFSAFAGNPYLVSLDDLNQRGFLPTEALNDIPAFPNTHVNYGDVIPFKLELLNQAYTRFKSHGSDAQWVTFMAFCEAQAYWLDDYALFMALKEAHGGAAWTDWADDIRMRKPAALLSWREKLEGEIEKQKVWQWFFYTQWLEVRAYANARGIKIIGDIPIFIAFDSADAWANPHLFYFDEQRNPTVVAGVPPDYFSETGQRWGNPLYRWERMQENGYRWWIDRFKSTLEFFDIIRVDHFRGFDAYWEIPADEPTAINGKWVEGPGQDFFNAVRDALGDDMPIIAEDLGVITPSVEKLRDDNNLPGMKVLQFAFAADASDPYLPHNYTQNCVVYTGTHDNDTTRGWYQQAPEAERDLVRRYLARDDSNISWDLIRLAVSSVADIAIYPWQDALGLGSDARMNTPGQPAGNWSWRFEWSDVPYWLAPQLLELSELYGRLPAGDAQDTPYRQSHTD